MVALALRFWKARLGVLVAVGLCAGCDQTSLQSRSKPILLVFTSQFCYQCQLDHPTVQRLHDGGHVRVKIIECDDPSEFQAARKQARIKQLPTYILVVRGKEYWRGNYIKDLLPVLRAGR